MFLKNPLKLIQYGSYGFQMGSFKSKRGPIAGILEFSMVKWQNPIEIRDVNDIWPIKCNLIVHI